MQQDKRVIWIVLDSVGVGELPDAAKYGDEGSNTLGNTAREYGGLKMPNLAKFGIGRITEVKGVEPETPAGAAGRMMIHSPGKDTTNGHWEMVGIISEEPFRTYLNGFPPEVIDALEKQTGRKVIGNKPASGTEIIKELGEEHMRTGALIVYTSADSVLQIAAHEEIIPIGELYRLCQIAREIMTGPNAVGRIIARPFLGQPGNFTRTEGRKDFSLEPPHDTLLDSLVQHGVKVHAVGKIEDIFAGHGISTSVHTKNNDAGMDEIERLMDTGAQGLIFANLVDYDMLYGHRNDVPGYAQALERFDERLPEIIGRLKPGDVLAITADHGCDPTTPSTDHSREYVPVMLFGTPVKPGVDVGTRTSLADLGATVAEYLGVPFPGPGKSFWGEVAR
jgi:phosphopentomutase